ncbi:MAG: hypothetical protein J7K51_06565 [Thermotogae bacterium]|nr:hypothetical protein [Thermotogota bacterium]
MFISFVLIQVKRTREKINGTVSFHTMRSHNRRDRSLPPVRFAEGE